MGLVNSAKKYIEDNHNVTCKICGERIYSYSGFECSKRGRKFVFVHKECVVKKNK